MFREERIPVPYNRLDAAERSAELKPVNDESERRLMIRELRKEDKRDRKDVVKISQKPILKQRLVHLYVSGYYNTRQMARILMVSEQSVRKTLKEPEVQNMIQAYQDTEKELVDQALKALRMRAIETQSELLESDNDVVRANVSKDILDRTGHKAKEEKKVEINVSYEERLKALVSGAIIEDVPYIIDDDGAQNNTEGAVNGD